MRDVTTRFIDENTIQSDVVEYFQAEMKSGSYSSDRLMRFPSQTAAEVELVFDRHGSLSEIHTAWGDNQIDRHATRYRAKTASSGVRVARLHLLSRHQVVGSWAGEGIVVRPSKSTMSLPPTAKGVAVVEFPYDAVKDDMMNSKRAATAGRALELLLVSVVRDVWVEEQPAGTVRAWPSEAASRQLTPPSEDQETSSSADPQAVIPEVPDATYYAFHDLEPTSELQLPDSLSLTIAAFNDLEQESRGKYLRSCYWLSEALARAQYSKSATLVAAVQSIESLLDEESPERCECCGQPMFKIGRRFRELLDRYAPESATERGPKDLLYSTRSKLTHGASLISTDVDVYGLWNDPRTVRTWHLLDRAISTARNVSRRWLLDRRLPAR